MKTIILVSLGLCLLVSISAEKSSHKHAGKLLKSGHELKESNVNLDDATAAAPKSALPLNEESPAVKPAAGREGGRKHHRHGKNKKGGGGGGGVAHHQQEQQQQQTGRTRKSHSKPKVNNNGAPKSHNKHGRKHGRGKQQAQ